MILLITPSERGSECAAAIEQATEQPTESVREFRRAVKLLRSGEYSAVVIDQYLLESDPQGADVLLQEAGAATPVYVNLAISGIERVVRELKFALLRAKREREALRAQAELGLRNEMNDDLTALLLSCELALQVPDVPAAAKTKLQSACDLAKQIRARLKAQVLARGDGGAKS